MASVISSESIEKLVKNTSIPLVLKQFCEWPLLEWTLEEWTKNLPTTKLSFRCKPSVVTPGIPIWERSCEIKEMTFANFFASSENGDYDWAYFDYKYIHEWFDSNNQIFQQVLWDKFGFPGRNSSDSSIWIGSDGAHTPCHQDTYGRNIVVQVFGKKRWILFPPEAGGLKPTRVPYEESSVYSKIDFSNPLNSNELNGLHGGYTVVLEPGDVLIVPLKWWHYVEHVSPVGITINTWIPCEEEDSKARIEEALIKLFIAQICQDLPTALLESILNPNEDDLPALPLTVAVLQVDSTLSKYKEFQSRKKGIKRPRIDSKSINTESSSKNDTIFDLDSYINNHSCIKKLHEINRDELKDIIKKNSDRKNITASPIEELEENDEENVGNKNLLSAIINSFCHPSVIKTIGENLSSQR